MKVYYKSYKPILMRTVYSPNTFFNFRVFEPESEGRFEEKKYKILIYFRRKDVQ